MSRCPCYVFTETRSSITLIRLPHSEIPGSQRVYRSPRLIAVSHVLHRLLAPRHPLCALCSLINLFRSCDQRSLITETRQTGISYLPSRFFSDSALKSCFCYPVCRCQRTSGLRYFRRQKNPTLSSDSNHLAVIEGGTKLSLNLQSQNIEEPTPSAFAFRSPVSGGISKLVELANSSTQNSQFPPKRCLRTQSPPAFA